MKRDKKHDELLIMRHFIDRFPDFPKGKLVQQESPDFIYKLNRKKNVNIELTEIILSGSNPQGLISEIFSQTQKAIHKKNKKLTIYNSNIPFQNWLIIHCESLNLSPRTRLEEELNNFQSDSNFDKTFLFDLFSGKIFDLSDQ
jgi:hypothetical protein